VVSLAIQTEELAGVEYTSTAAELVFGSIDGLLSVLGIVSAAAAAALAPQQIFTAGLGGAIAGTLSVFAATYLSQTAEKKSRLLDVLASAKPGRKRSTGRPVPSGTEHPTIRRMLARINRRAILSGMTISTMSMLSSLALLLPLVLISSPYSGSEISMLLGLFLLLLLGALRGVSLKQPGLKSGIKMVLLGAMIILVSRIIGDYVTGILG
jgi:VIT1/CCC1 family predicted Fe2+/Mn2+ transporter